MGTASNTTSGQTSQAQTINVTLPAGKHVRNIKRVSTDTGYPTSWTIINDTQIQVSVTGGAGSQQSTPVTTYSCPSTYAYNDGTYSGNIPLSSGQGTPTCNYSGNLSRTVTTTTTVPHGETCSSTYTDGSGQSYNLTSQTSGSPNDTCNYSGTASKTCTATQSANSSTSTTYTTVYGYTVTVEYFENNSRSYHINKKGRNGRGIIR